ncbi:MAG: PP2C family protein-serine/threonine phosphatase [Terracidiphilus sp.]
MRHKAGGWLVAAAVLCGMASGQPAALQRHGATSIPQVLMPERHLPPAQPSVAPTPKVVFDATHLGTPLKLDRGWRVGVTSNRAAASADFDDTKWPVKNAGDSLEGLQDLDHPEDGGGAQQGPPPTHGHGRPFVWFRLHVKLPPQHGPVSLLIVLPVVPSTGMSIDPGGPGLAIFANGKEIEPEGPHGAAPEMFQEITRLYKLGLAPTDTDLTLVARTIYIPFGAAAYTNFFTARELKLGMQPDLQKELELWSANNLFERLPRLVNSILLSILTIFLLALYVTQKGHVEYLWLALHELAQAPIAFIDLAGSTAMMDRGWYEAVVLQLVVISAYLYFEFLVAFLSLPRRWYIRALRWTAPVLLGVGPTLELVFGFHSWSAILVIGAIWLGALTWMIGWIVFTFTTLILATLRRNFEAGLLLIPLLLTMVGIADPILSGSLSDWGGQTYHSPLTLQAGPIPIHFASFADFAGLLAIVLIIFVRFLHVQHDQERSASELAAARSVQELMIPKERQQTPGFEVDSVYSPATEVGGDFFHVESTGDGGLLVVVGDVAGKGLQAAMRVSMIMGALRHTQERSPAKILRSLNRVLAGNESLTTCQALLLRSDGEVVMANAGHLPPYLNSQEVTLPGGLPLGILPDAAYEEVQLYLHPGDRLLLLSDGVVEARKPTGELFGFERVHNLSNQSAFYIADAAKEFGQEDDITVLTVRRLAEAKAA